MMEDQGSGWSFDNLLSGVISGEAAAWAETVRRYDRLVLHAAAGIGLSRTDAADVAQLTWIQLWRHAHQIRQPDRLASWLVAIARREAIRMSATSSRYVLCAEPASQHENSAAVACDRYQADREYDEVVERALNRLPARYRTLLRLLSCELDLSYSEVAERMGVPIGSIGPMRMRALRMLEKTPEFASGSFPRPAQSLAAKAS